MLTSNKGPSFRLTADGRCVSVSVNGCVRIADRSSPAEILHWVLCICSVYKGGRLKEGVNIRKAALLCAFYLKSEQERETPNLFL